MTADKKTLPVLLAAFLLLTLPGCNDGTKTTGDISKNNSRNLTDRKQVANNSTAADDRLYFGKDWADQARSRNASSSRGSSGSAASSQQPHSTWSLVLGTFTGQNHRAAAEQMVQQLPVIAPQVRGARVHTTSKGSMVVYGHYTGRDDPQAEADQERFKAIEYQGRPVFNRVILARLDLRAQQGELHPYDLLSARKAHPNVNPLYTLDVALWDDFGSGQLSYDEIRRRAEEDAARLRRQGFEAYFYHDDVNKRSVVTVGLFDRRAIHPTSGLYSSEVTDLIKRHFPQRLVNGEPLLVGTRGNPNNARPQQPVLVLVPSL